MIQAFASFGFAESHSLSFALLVYASAWLKLHYPAIYLMGLLRAWPMGFYSPATLVSDAERHGVKVFTPCVQHSEVLASVEAIGGCDTPTPTGLDSCLAYEQEPAGDFDPQSPDPSRIHRRDSQLVVRLGLASIDGIGQATAEKIVAERTRGGLFDGIYDLTRRVGLISAQVEALSVAGAFDGLGLGRRDALWLAGPAATAKPDYLAGTHHEVNIPLFAPMSGEELMRANRISTGISPDDHPVRYLRQWLSDQGVIASRDLATWEPGRRVWLGGIITHRQRPATAKGTTFLNLEDEFGLVNVICSVGMWRKYRLILRHAPAVIIRGILERSPEGVISLVADGVSELALGTPVAARNFQ
jgi:error-prone DNA polymerase